MKDTNLTTAIFTVCNLKYLHFAKTLADSVYNSNKLQTHIFIFDKKTDLDLNDSYTKIYWIEEVADVGFFQRAFKYNVIELTTAYKPFLTQFLLKDYNKVIFFDPDVLLIGKIDNIINILNENDFLITPHRISFIDDPASNINLQRFGFYNLGFFAARNSKQSLNILEWWWNQCKTNCFDESHYGSFTDQKWMDLAVKFFTSIHVLKNPGYNVAWWNLVERKITHENQCFLINNSPLIFFHYSAFDENLLAAKQFERGHNNQIILNKIISIYKLALKKNQTLKYKDYNYSYDYLENGKYINQIARRSYSSYFEDFKDIQNPFRYERRIHKFLKKNFLYEKKPKNFLLIKEKDLEKFKIHNRIYKALLRIILYFIGPSYFLALLRLFIYTGISTINSHLWIRNTNCKGK